MDWSPFGGVAEVRALQHSDRDAVRSFRCETPGQNFTRDARRVIRRAPDEIASDSDVEAWIAVAELRDAGVVGVVVYRAQAIGREPNQETRPFIAALGVRQEFRRREIGTLLKTATMLDMADRGIDGPTVSLVNRRNVAMLTLNESWFEANFEPDPDDPGDLVVTVAIEPVD